MSISASEKQGVRLVAGVLAVVGLGFASYCGYGLVSGEVSIGRPLRVTIRLAESPMQFWMVWSLWAALAVAAGYGVWWLFRQTRNAR